MEPIAASVATTIEVIRKTIRQIRDRKESIGEQNTKAALIDPLLSALGWNRQDLDETRREYRRKPHDNPVDYAFFLNRTVCLLMEAKSLEKDLADHKWVSQNLSYATVVGVKWCVLTNGDEYRIYNAHAAVDVDEKLFRRVSISDSDPKFLTDTLLLLSKEKMRGSLLDELWKAHFIDHKVRTAFESLLVEEDGALIRGICKKAAGVSRSEVCVSLKRAVIRIDFPIPAAGQAATLLESARNATAIGAARAKATAARHGGNNKARKPGAATAEVSLPGLIAVGLLTAPLEVERTYKGVLLTASVRPDGTVSFGGKSYDSLSTAGGVARASVIGTPAGRPYPPTNGWAFWQFRDGKTGQLRNLESLRREFLARAG